MCIRDSAENRKELVKTLSGHFGQKSEYLGPPSFAYRIGSITVDRDAKVILEDDSMEDEVRMVLFQNDMAEETQETQTEEPEAEIKMPIGSMTPQGIINLINMMHSKQYLINLSLIHIFLCVSVEIFIMWILEKKMEASRAVSVRRWW